MLPNSAEVVIVGGGVMGASTAYHLAARGQRGVVLLERQSLFGQGATGRCAGGVRYQFSTEVNIRLSLASLPMLERFAEEIGQEVDYRHCGYLFLLTREEDEDSFRRHFDLQRRLGVEVEWLGADAVRRRLPQMRLDDVRGGAFGPRDGLVDPNGVVQGYLQRARALGVRTFTEVEVTAIRTDARGVAAVVTPQGEIATRTLVDAAGPWAAPLAAMVGLDLPIQPVRRQLVVTTPLPQIPADFPFVIDFAQALYFHREGPGLLVGRSNRAQEPGFDESVDPEWEWVILESAMDRMPLLEAAGISTRWAGLYEVTPDAHPILGPTPVGGFHVVGGFSGHGFMHGPIAGLLMAEILLDGAARTVDVSGLDLGRFTEQRSVQELHVV